VQKRRAAFRKRKSAPEWKKVAVGGEKRRHSMQVRLTRLLLLLMLISVFLIDQTQEGGKIMPEYEYRCEGCKHVFSIYRRISDRERSKPSCPKCKGKKTQQQISSFNVKTSRKS